MNIRQLTRLVCTLSVMGASLGARQAVSPAAAPAPAAATPVKATVDASKTYAPISPHIYGMFIEHAGSLVYSGIWAEMIGDRKFYYPVAAQSVARTPAAPAAAGGPGGGRGRRRGDANARRWTRIGPAEAISMDARHAYAGDHSPAIVLSATEPRGIRQAGLALMQGREYTGRIVLAGDPSAVVTVGIVWGSGDAERQSVTIDKLAAEYATFPLRFKSPVEGGAKLESRPSGRAHSASAPSR